MAILKRFGCPKCCVRSLPFTQTRKLIRHGFFVPPDVECARCGQMYHLKLSWKDAAWSWPLTVVFFAGVVCMLQGPLFRALHHSFMYSILAGILAGLCGIGIMMGFRSVAVDKAMEIDQSSKRRWQYITLIQLLLYILFFKFFTLRWCFISSIITSFVIYIIFYFGFTKKE